MRIKLFEEFDEKPTISFPEACNWILENYDETRVCEIFDDEILNWVDSDWEDEHESEYDWYVDFGNGEAENVVREQIIDDLKSNFNLDFDIYDDQTDLHDFIANNFDVLSRI